MKRGAPYKSDAARRSQVYQVRLNPAERKILEQRAKQAKLTIAAFLRAQACQ